MKEREVRGPLKSMSRVFGQNAADPRQQQQPQAGPGPAGYPPSGAGVPPPAPGYPPPGAAGYAPGYAAPPPTQQASSSGFLGGLGQAASDVGRDMSNLGQDFASRLGFADPPPVRLSLSFFHCTASQPTAVAASGLRLAQGAPHRA